VVWGGGYIEYDPGTARPRLELGRPVVRPYVLADADSRGEFAESGWITPLETFYNNPGLVDPALDLEGFFPILLESMPKSR